MLTASRVTYQSILTQLCRPALLVAKLTFPLRILMREAFTHNAFWQQSKCPIYQYE